MLQEFGNGIVSWAHRVPCILHLYAISLLAFHVITDGSPERLKNTQKGCDIIDIASSSTAATARPQAKQFLWIKVMASFSAEGFLISSSEDLL